MVANICLILISVVAAALIDALLCFVSAPGVLSY